MSRSRSPSHTLRRSAQGTDGSCVRSDVERRRFGQAVLGGLALASGGLLALGAATPACAAALGDTVRWPEAITLLDGSSLLADQFRDNALLVVFFSTTCPFCARHNSHVQKLVTTSAGLPLHVLGVALDKSADSVRAYAHSHGYSFDVTLDARALREALSPRKVIPLSCVIDRAGRLRELVPGEMFEDDVLELAKWARA
jgi:peroxiredoxin